VKAAPGKAGQWRHACKEDDGFEVAKHSKAVVSDQYPVEWGWTRLVTNR